MGAAISRSWPETIKCDLFQEGSPSFCHTSIRLGQTEQTKLGLSAESLHQKLQKTVPLAEKVMATTFLGSETMIFNDYLEKGTTTIIDEHYASLLHRLKTKLQENCLRFAHQKVLLPHDSAPAHFSSVVAKLIELDFQLVRQLLYSAV